MATHMALNGSKCEFNQGLTASCSLDVPRFAPLLIRSKLNPCSSPPELDMEFHMGSYGQWEWSFLSGPTGESRQIGPSFWPLWLRFQFREGPRQPDYFLKACLETVKTGENTCFLNQNLSLPNCDTQGEVSQSAIAISVICLILVTLFGALVGAFAYWFRQNRRWRRYQRHKNILSADCSFSSSPPLLPGAVKYPSIDRGGKSTEGADSSLLPPDSTQIFDISSNFRQSKLVQTSLNSLPRLVASSQLFQSQTSSGSSREKILPSSTSPSSAESVM